MRAEASASTEMEQIACKTSLRASPGALFTRRHGTSTWRKIIASLLAPIPPVNFAPHPSPSPFKSQQTPVRLHSRGCPVAGVFRLLFFFFFFLPPLLPLRRDPKRAVMETLGGGGGAGSRGCLLPNASGSLSPSDPYRCRCRGTFPWAERLGFLRGSPFVTRR